MTLRPLFLLLLVACATDPAEGPAPLDGSPPPPADAGASRTDDAGEDAAGAQALDAGLDAAPDASPLSADAEPALDAVAAVDAGVDEVRVVQESCAGRTPRGVTCRTLEVSCGGLEPLPLALHVHALPAGTAQRGVIVLASGGAGTGLWSGPATADAAIARLAAAGFLAIERQWLDARDRGWFESAGGQGVPVAACRLAAVIAFVDREYRSGDQPLCATGNSGGSAELTYAVTRQSAGELLDLAVPSSGPFHSLELACAGTDDAPWQTECAALKARHCPSCASRGCALGAGPRGLVDRSYGASTPCTGTQTPLDRPRLALDGPLSMARALPHTRMVLLIGEQDEGGYAAMSAALFEGLAQQGVDVAFETEPGTGHEFASTEAGARHLEAVIARECVRRH